MSLKSTRSYEKNHIENSFKKLFSSAFHEKIDSEGEGIRVDVNANRNEEPLLLCSVQSKLAYLINERFYGGLHYAWCSPGFDCPSKLFCFN